MSQRELRNGVSQLEFLWPELLAHIVLGAVFLAASALLISSKRVALGWTCLFGAASNVDLIWRHTGALTAGAALVLLFAALCLRPLRWLGEQTAWWAFAALLLFGTLAVAELRVVVSPEAWPRVHQLDRWSTDDRLFVTRGDFALRAYRRLRATDWAGPWRFEWAQGSGAHRARLIVEGIGRDTKLELVSGEGTTVPLDGNRVGLDLMFGGKGGAATLRPVAPQRPLRVLAVADLEGQFGGLAARLATPDSRPDVVILLGNMIRAAAPLDVFELRQILDDAGVVAMAVPGPLDSGIAGGLYDALLVGKRPVRGFAQYGTLRAFRLDQSAPLKSSDVQALTLPGPFAIHAGPCLIATNGPFLEGDSDSSLSRASLEAALRAELTLMASAGAEPGLVEGEGGPLVRVGAMPYPDREGQDVLVADFLWPLEQGVTGVAFDVMVKRAAGLRARAEAVAALVAEQAALADLLPIAVGGVLTALFVLIPSLRVRRRS